MSWVPDQARLTKLTLDELLDRIREVEQNPASREERPGSPWRFNARARWKLDFLRWAVTDKLREMRAKRGDLVRIEG